MSSFWRRVVPSFRRNKEVNGNVSRVNSEDFTNIEPIVPDISGEVQPELECSFSEDEEGKLLSKLWSEYISTYDCMESGERYATEVRHDAFNRFARQFIFSYSDVADVLEKRVELSNTSKDAVKECQGIDCTVGHPTEVIVQIASMLTEYLDVGEVKPSTAATGESLELENGFLNISVKRVFAENSCRPSVVDEEQRGVSSDVDSAKKTSAARLTLLHILHSLAIAMHWQHNRIVVSNRLGLSFAQEVVGILQFFSEKIDDAIASWTAARDRAHHNRGYFPSDLLEDMEFISSAVLAVVHIIACSFPTMMQVSEYTTTGFLPPHPWTESALKAMGVFVPGCTNSSGRDIDEGQCNTVQNPEGGKNTVVTSGEVVKEIVTANSNSDREYKTDGMANRVSNSTRTCAFDARGQRKSDSKPDNALANPSFCPAMRPITVPPNGDTWSGMLLTAGSDSVLLSLLRKVVALSRIMAVSVNSADSKDSGKSEWNETPMDGWVESTLLPWKSCAILQNEILFALLAINTSHPDVSSNRFMIFNGAQTLNMLLLESSNIYTGKDRIAIDLVYERGILCLRLNELLNQYFSVHNESKAISFVVGDSSQYTALITESLGWFLSWVRASYRYEEEYEEEYYSKLIGGESVSYSLFDDNVVVGSVHSPDICVDPLQNSDLWPWQQQCRSEMSSIFKGGERSIGLNSQPTRSHYRLCHSWCEIDTDKSSSKSTDQSFPNVLEKWSAYIEQMVIMGEKNDASLPAALPWFLRGRAARAWQVVFSILANTCLAKSQFRTNDVQSKRNHVISNLTMVWDSVLMTLDEEIDAMSTRLHPNHAQIVDDVVPMLEMHFLLFLGRCIQNEAVFTLDEYSQESGMWSSLFSKKFFLGGREAISKLLQRNLTQSMDCDERQEKDIIAEKNVSDNPNTYLVPLLRCRSSEVEVTAEAVRENKERIIGYSWIYLHDCVLDIISMIASTMNQLQSDEVVSESRSVDVKHIVSVLQIACESGYDDVSFQVLRWMKWYLDTLKPRCTSVRNSFSSQFFRSAFAVCGYHLGDANVSTILYNDRMDDPMDKVQTSRPFMWPARRAAIELITYVQSMPGCDRWMKVFAEAKVKTPVPNNKVSDILSPATMQHKAATAKHGKSPAHVTLILLFVDSRLRGALCHILIKVLTNIVAISLSEHNSIDDTCLEQSQSNRTATIPETGTSSKNYQKNMSIVHRVRANIHRSNSEDNSNVRLYDSCISNIFLDLIELVKWSSSQPRWYDGAAVSCTILSYITQFLRSYRDCTAEMKYTQQWLHKTSIISEMVSSLISCINFSLGADWSQDNRLALVHQGFACLTAAMAGNPKNKSEFKSVMMTRRSGKAPIISTPPTQSKNSQKSRTVSSSSINDINSIVLMYDDIVDMILHASPEPLVETVLVLFDMTLDGQLANFRDIVSASSVGIDQISCGIFANKFDRPQICNLNSIPIIFGIISYCSGEIQQCILNSFHQLVAGRASMVNISNCSQMRPSLLDLVLDHFPEIEESAQCAAVTLLQTLGRHSISVAQLKRMFQMMRSDGDYRPVYTTHLLRGLQGMIDDDESPRHSFVFGGVNSGLELPTIPRWPAQSAYTVSLWLRVESPHNDSDTAVKNVSYEYRPCVLCLRCNNGNGVEIYLKRSGTSSTKFRILIRCHGPGNIDTFQVPGIYVIEGRWHYFALSHRSSGFRSSSEAEVLLDDHFVRHKMSFPRFTESIETPLFGDCVSKFREASNVNTTMRGQMSAIYVFSDALTEGQLRGIYGLGPSYFYAFEPYSTVHRDLPTPSSSKKQAVDPVLSVLDGSLTHLIALAYNPAVWKGDLFLDNTPEKNQIKWKPATVLSTGDTMAQYGEPSSQTEVPEIEDKLNCAYHLAGKMHARGLPGTYRSTISDVRIALNSLGGISVLLPLFTQCDQPRVQPVYGRGGGSKIGSRKMEVVDEVDSDICVVLLEVILTLLVKTSENESFLKEYQGISLISYFLERMSPVHMTTQSLDIIFRIRDRVSWNINFSNDVFEHLLLNFKMWVFTSFEVQQRLFREIEIVLCSMDIHDVRRMNVLNKLVDALYLLYDYEKPQLSSVEHINDPHDDNLLMTTDPTNQKKLSTDGLQQVELLGSVYHADRWIHSSSGRVEGVKLTDENLSHIRALILQIVVRIIKNGNGDGIIVPDDVTTLVRYVIVTSSSTSRVEVLSILLNLLCEEGGVRTTSVPKVLLGLSAGKGLLALLPLVSNANVQVRLYAFLLLCICLVQAAIYDDIGCTEPFNDKTLAEESSQLRTQCGVDSSDESIRNIRSSSADDSYVHVGQGDYSFRVDTYTRLGIPVSSLGRVMMWVQNEIIGHTAVDSAIKVDNEVQESHKLATIVAQALYCTLLGQSCNHLRDMVSLVYLSDREGEDRVSCGISSESDKTKGSIGVNGTDGINEADTHTLDYSGKIFFFRNGAEGTRNKSEIMIRIPMIFTALLGVAGQKSVPLAIRLSICTNIHTCIVQDIDNCDRILRVAAWQESLFQVVRGEMIRIKEIEQSVDLQSDIIQRYLVQCRSLIDVCVRILCDVQAITLQCGKPISAPVIVSPNSTAENLVAQLTADQILKEIEGGERQLGSFMLRETMSFVYAYQDIDIGVDMHSTALKILHETVRVLLRQSYTLSSSKSIMVEIEGNENYFAQLMLSLNIWLVGDVVKEYFASYIEVLFPLHGEVACKLVESLIELMEPLRSMATVSLFHGRDIGTFFVQNVTADCSSNTETLSGGSESSSTQQNSPRKATVVSSYIEGIYLIMVRVLCSVLSGVSVSDTTVSATYEMPILVLTHLRSLVSYICDQRIENFGYEMCRIISRLSTALQCLSFVDEKWVHDAVIFLVDLVCLQRSTLVTLLVAASQQGSEDILEEDCTSLGVFESAMSAVRPSPVVDPLEASNKMELHAAETLSHLINILSVSVSDPIDTLSAAGISLAAIRAGLRLPPDFDLDWDIWMFVMRAVTREADTIETEFRHKRLAEIGTLNHSDEIGVKVLQQQDLESKLFKEVLQHSEAAYVNVSEVRMKLFREEFRAMEANDRRIVSKWNQIISRLANERGPWGLGNDKNVDVFWKIDRTETSMRTTPVLLRNEAGSRHQVASFLSRGKSELSSSPSLSDSEGTSDDLHVSPGVRRPLSAVISPQGLWRDLMKYQKKNSETDILVDVNDRLDMEDDIDDPKELTPEGKVLFRAPVEIITNATNSAGGSTHGTIEITKTKVSFTRSSEENFSFHNKTGNTEFMWACQCFPSTTWNTADIINVLCRTYQLRFVAVEMFFTSRLTVFINLFEHSIQRQMVDCIRRHVKPPYIQPHYGYRPSSIISRAIHQPSGRTMTQAWVHRNISNFEYLMYLNTVAGRSFNDMGQYPVFPWVISNYTSAKLNLTDPKNFRDLRWSMGAQNESQREIFMQKYRDLEDCYHSALEERKNMQDPSMASDCLPPFHYGSHFSTMGFVLWYLIRMEPFTSLNIWMQDGRFDKPDRIFDTIELCYRGCTSNQSDVKELIPEFFYCPEFLENLNGIAMGTTSANKELGPVELPPWAKNPHDFIRQHRNALESEYVSTYLHNWIDLVFGYKQRPPHMGGTEAAVTACNVYFHLTYAGAVDLDDLRENDSPLYKQMVRQIDNYGQTPAQLFNRPHPPRQSLDKVDIIWPLASPVRGADTLPRGAPLPERPHRVVCFKEYVVSVNPVVYITESTSWEKLITIDTSRIVATHFWQLRPPDVVPPFQFKPDTQALKYSQGTFTGGFNMPALRLSQYNSGSRERRIGAPFAPHQLLRSDYVHDMSRTIKIPFGNKALFQKEEATRSNMRRRPHTRGTSGNTVATSSAPVASDSRQKRSESDGMKDASVIDCEGGVSKDTAINGAPIVVRRLDEHVSGHLFAVLPENRLVFSCGHWDYSFKATAIDSGRLLQSVSQHRDVVTCMDVATDFQYTWLVTGSRDCTLVIWDVNPLADRPIMQQPKHVLYGHDDAVNCLAINAELDIVASGSDDGTIIIHKLREGTYIRSIRVEPNPTNVPPSSPSSTSSGGKVSSWRGLASHSHEGPISRQRSGSDMSCSSDTLRTFSSCPERSVNRSFLISKRRVHYVGLSIEGFLVAYSNDDSALYTFSINGNAQARRVAGEKLHAFCFSEDGRVLITGGERGLVVMRWIHSLELSNVDSKWEFDSVLDGQNIQEGTRPFNSPIRSIYLTKQERHMIVGLECGELRILAQDSDYLRRRLHSKLMEIGIIENI